MRWPVFSPKLELVRRCLTRHVEDMPPAWVRDRVLGAIGLALIVHLDLASLRVAATSRGGPSSETLYKN